jgi:hypothetical protein
VVFMPQSARMDSSRVSSSSFTDILTFNSIPQTFHYTHKVRQQLDAVKMIRSQLRPLSDRSRVLGVAASSLRQFSAAQPLADEGSPSGMQISPAHPQSQFSCIARCSTSHLL